MVYKKINIRGALKGYGNLISIQKDNKLLFLSKENFETLKEYDLSDFMFAMHFYENKIVLSNLKDRHFEILPEELKLIEHKGPCYPITQSGIHVVSYCPRDKKYKIHDANNVINNIIDRNFDLETKVHDNILTECILHQSTESFVRAKNLITGNEEWRIDLEGKVVRCDSYGNYIVLEYHDQSGNTVVLDINEGKECWSKEEIYSRIESDAGLILFGNNQVTVCNISNGETINQVTVSPEYQLGYYPYFIDYEGIYYTIHEGSFGKISKVDGTILWEFDLIDDKGEKRKLSDWILLGNGNLVLQAMPNHPNGDLTCIFNPEENIEYSKVKNGERN